MARLTRGSNLILFRGRNHCRVWWNLRVWTCVMKGSKLEVICSVEK